MTRAEAFDAVGAELTQALGDFPPFHSGHEGLAVIEEEFLELRDEVFWGKSDEAKKTEAKQLAAMAVRYLMECTE